MTNSNVSQKKANVFPVVPAGRYSWGNPDESLLEDRRGDLPEFPARNNSVRLARLAAARDPRRRRANRPYRDPDVGRGLEPDRKSAARPGE